MIYDNFFYQITQEELYVMMQEMGMRYEGNYHSYQYPNFNNSDLSNKEYPLDWFDCVSIDIIGFVNYKTKSNKDIKIHYILGEYSLLYFSEDLNQFFIKNYKVVFNYGSERYFSQNCLDRACRDHVFHMYKDAIDIFCNKYFGDTINNESAKAKFMHIVSDKKLRNSINGKSMSYFKSLFYTPAKIPYIYGLSDNFTRVDVHFYSNDESKYFDYIKVESYLSIGIEHDDIQKRRIEFVKENKNIILKMYLAAIRENKRWKKYDIPINVLKIDDLVLNKAGALIATLSLKDLKETSQS